ncbi:sel1 repeat family protein [Pseudomonas sp. MSSRFD41]|uniref:tetratricopeptide repeat protein n=1 Tax=Pseudomonas sp. MSSRFD41 TaxID=1310370 RepID=UPI00163B611B|nr:tetratricopeptide repeat protein [Pseudomonas sp. MSSRFD41]MBC2656205.1 sel1 repeat family protein [Pseudomonas sp. MSSRFD41]
MNKILALLLLGSLLGGCQSDTSAQTDAMVGLRCWHYRDQESLSREMLDYIRRQGEAGNPMCQTLLATLYERGHGVVQDTARARALYLSQTQANPGAYYHLGRLDEQEADYLRARDHYQRAAAAGSRESALALARLMEEGKGGPQDLPGAQQLYFSVLKQSGDDAWKGIDRLRGHGLELNAEQQARYNQVWTASARSRLSRKLRLLQHRTLGKLKLGPDVKPAVVEVRFVPGSAEPRLKLLESSGDTPLDQTILQALGSYRFVGEPIPQAGQDDWRVKAHIDPHAR